LQIYILVTNAEALHHHRGLAFDWGYGHSVVFASLPASGAMLEVVADGLISGSSSHAVAHTLAIGLVAADLVECHVMARNHAAGGRRSALRPTALGAPCGHGHRGRTRIHESMGNTSGEHMPAARKAPAAS